MKKTCDNGHIFEKSSSCPVCPICSNKEMQERFAGFPKIGSPAFRALDRVGIVKLSDLTKYTREELLALHGFGPRALRLLEERLKKEHLTFK